MEPEARKLRENVRKLETDLSLSKRDLEAYESSCKPHKFGQTTYEPIHHKAYRIPGDPPGTMGVDWQGPMDVPEQTILRWKKECFR